MLALAAARQSGLKVPKKTTDAGVSYIKQRFTPATGGFTYMKNGAGQPNFSRTAAAIAALQAMGIHKEEEVEKSWAYLVQNQPVPTPRPDMHYYYGHCYAARAMHHNRSLTVAAQKMPLGDSHLLVMLPGSAACRSRSAARHALPD